MDVRAWFEELRRRRVFRALVAWGVFAFAVLQAAEPILHALHLPDAALTGVVLALAAGFPLVAVGSWVWDLRAGRLTRTAPPEGEGPRGAPLWAALVGLGALAALPGLAAWVALRPPAPGPGAAAPAGAADPSVAVLPFRDLSPAHDQSWFTDGLTEELIDALSRAGGLKVSGRSSAFALAGREQDPAAVGKALGVGHVLRGSVRRDGARLRITAQLVTLDGFGVWSDAYDAELRDALEVQERIAAAVASALRVRLLPAAHPAVPAQAHEDVLVARQLLQQNEHRACQRAAALLERTVTSAPDYAQAWAVLADARLNLADVSDDPAERETLLAATRDAAERSIRLDPAQPDAYLMRAAYRQFSSWDWDGALADVERALAVAPASAEAHRHRAELLAMQGGRLTEALDEARRAAELDPLDLGAVSQLGKLLLSAGRLDEARTVLERCLALHPESSSTPFHLGTAHLLAGDARGMLEISARSTEPANQLLGRGVALQGLGRREEARAAVTEIEARHGVAWSFQAAEGWAWLGDRDAAFRCLEQAVAHRDMGLIMLRTSPYLAPLRTDPRWPALLARIHLRP